ncbi:hypothetical protein RFI_21382 [Reticulomyxa filosa]|uniref:Uncharacterized protein n=1 Tax=Reticulomyxa filosa TaxID=46433 RepID=X6MQQ6_RETFI|nr:hypothetical protein RFI_21382 [Reticulomyxa filosa]|eukprot:ETO15976.1 hypothetical protein RFI_21382 [Reticulomyxa filosa]
MRAIKESFAREKMTEYLMKILGINSPVLKAEDFVCRYASEGPANFIDLMPLNENEEKNTHDNDDRQLFQSRSQQGGTSNSKTWNRSEQNTLFNAQGTAGADMEISNTFVDDPELNDPDLDDPNAPVLKCLPKQIGKEINKLPEIAGKVYGCLYKYNFACKSNCPSYRVCCCEQDCLLVVVMFEAFQISHTTLFFLLLLFMSICVYEKKELSCFMGCALVFFFTLFFSWPFLSLLKIFFLNSYGQFLLFLHKIGNPSQKFAFFLMQISF